MILFRHLAASHHPGVPGTRESAHRRPLQHLRALQHLRPLLLLVVVIAALAASATTAQAQSLLNRTPNISGAWVGLPGTLQLDLLHRFGVDEEGPDATPSAFLAWGFGGHSLLGVHYTSDSPLVRDGGDALEVQARFAPLANAVGAAFDLGFTAAWNAGAGSLDAEASVGMPLGPAELTGVVRAFREAWGQEDARWAAGLGGTLQLHESVALAADAVRPVDLHEGEAFGWGAAVQVAVPSTPVTASLHAANTASPSLQGSSMRFGGTRWGVALSLPLSPDRYRAGGRGGADLPRAGERDLVAGDTVQVEMAGGTPDPQELRVVAGTYVVWTNGGDDVHGVTAGDGSWQSPLLAPAESFGRVFTEVGTWTYQCSLHPEETGVVEVVEGD